ncbi:hypothetical protein ABZZ74_46810 [Streptomyces sp. NPDC006476]|uniref:COG4315 family predicted lipoprotein n=1 Tax=Streptomyces sp. NPDC006476 TaxID=3157175 RepID=UPI0033B28338
MEAGKRTKSISRHRRRKGELRVPPSHRPRSVSRRRVGVAARRVWLSHRQLRQHRCCCGPGCHRPGRGHDAGRGGTAAAGNAGSGGMVSTNMLMAKQMSGMGTVVTDAQGWTLYRYAKDQVNMSMCTGNCAQTWMPVMADGTPKGMGVHAKIGTVTRDDGMKQITLAGWPLYRYMGDTKAGDMNGQGKNGTWSLVTPAGKMMAMASGTSNNTSA